jgi:hypothetical protein
MKLKHLFAICLAFACGAPDDGYEDESDIGQAEQAMSAKSSQFGGIRYGHMSRGTPCPYLSAANQTCFVPRSKHIWVWITNSVAPTIDPILWRGAFSNAWAIIQNSGQAAGFDLSLQQAANDQTTIGLYFDTPLSGSANLVDSFYSKDATKVTFLTENYPGTWAGVDYGDMYVDMAKFNANNCSGTCSMLLATQIAGAAIINAMGLGYQTLDTNSLSSRTVTIAPKTKGMTSTQLCLASSLNTTGSGTWAYSGQCN